MKSKVQRDARVFSSHPQSLWLELLSVAMREVVPKRSPLGLSRDTHGSYRRGSVDTAAAVAQGAASTVVVCPARDSGFPPAAEGSVLAVVLAMCAGGGGMPARTSWCPAAAAASQARVHTLRPSTLSHASTCVWPAPAAASHLPTGRTPWSMVGEAVGARGASWTDRRDTR